MFLAVNAGDVPGDLDRVFHGLGAGDSATCEHQLLHAPQPRHAGNAREHPLPADQPAADVHVAELSIVGGEREVGLGSDLEAAADGVAVQHRHRELGDVVVGHRRDALEVRRKAVMGERVEVGERAAEVLDLQIVQRGSRAEVVARAREEITRGTRDHQPA